MPKTSFGLPGKNIGIKDSKMILKKIDIDKIIESCNNKTIEIPNFQRELEEDKVEGIIDQFEKKYKKGENYLVKHGYTLSLCKLSENKSLFVIDGQHRLKALKELYHKGYVNVEIIVRINLCDSLQEMKNDFKLLNSNSKIPFMYKSFENLFLNNTMLKLKNKLKNDYKNLFNRNKKKSTRTHRIHINTFFDFLKINKIKKLFIKNGKDFGDFDFLYNKLIEINKLVRSVFIGYKKKNKLNHFLNKIDQKKIEENEFYLVLDNVIWDKFLFNKKELRITSIKYIKTKIPKCLKDIVIERDFKGKFKGKCYVCNKTISPSTAQIGHIKSEYNGGKTNAQNLKAICKSCNCSMGIENLETFKKKYFSQNIITC